MAFKKLQFMGFQGCGLFFFLIYTLIPDVSSNAHSRLSSSGITSQRSLCHYPTFLPCEIQHEDLVGSKECKRKGHWLSAAFKTIPQHLSLSQFAPATRTQKDKAK